MDANRFSIEGFARLFEGEGTIGFTYGGRTGKVPWLYIRLHMIDEDIIRAVHEQFGGSMQGPYSRPTRPTSKPFWQWTLGGHAAADLCVEILPYLFSRRSIQVETALHQYNLKRM